MDMAQERIPLKLHIVFMSKSIVDIEISWHSIANEEGATKPGWKSILPPENLFTAGELTREGQYYEEC